MASRFDSVLDGVAESWRRFLTPAQEAPTPAGEGRVSSILDGAFATPDLQDWARVAFGGAPAGGRPDDGTGFGSRPAHRGSLASRVADEQRDLWGPPPKKASPKAAGSGTPPATPPAKGTAAPTTTGGNPAAGLQPDDNVMRWYPIAKKYADEYGVPVEAIMAVIQHESGGNPGARSKDNGGGLGSAVGLMQLIPKYHASDGADLTNPEENIKRGVKYFAYHYHKRGEDSGKAMAGYFGGDGAFDAAGNVKGSLSDVNGTTIGGYVSRWKNTEAAWRNRLSGGQQPAAAPATGKGSGWGWFGGRRFPVTTRYGTTHADDPEYPGSKPHRGIDLGAPENTELTSAVDGVVEQAGEIGGGYGNAVVIRLADGNKLILGHLGRVDVKAGTRVGKGMRLGVTGGRPGTPGAGLSTGAHLHLEANDAQGNAVDPGRYFDFN